MSTAFAMLAQAVIEETPVPRLSAGNVAVVLERIARGAGATRWYLLSSSVDLPRICQELSPGSVVSFYYDQRVERLPFGDDAVVRILDIVAKDGEAVVGRLSPDGYEIIVDFVGGPTALGEFAEEVSAGEYIYVGRFPSRDDNGRDSVTVTLPDQDGITRSHPH